MMIFDHNRQTLTKHSHSYGAKVFAGLWTKRAALGPETLLWSTSGV